MEIRRVLAILRRRWWLVISLPLIVLVGTLVNQDDRPYVAEFRQTVILPGDNQDTGNAERPELMITDDLPQLVRSLGFADRVMVALPKVPNPAGVDLSKIDALMVRDSIDATIYSRVLTIRVTRHDPEQARIIAQAASDALPDFVNFYAIANNAPPATVRMFNPVEVNRETRSRVILVVQTLVALAVSGGLAGLASGLDRRMYEDDEIERTLALPILADVRDPLRSHEGVPSFLRLGRRVLVRQEAAP